jgi:peptide/nickel transport system substrate-binding protein
LQGDGSQPNMVWRRTIMVLAMMTVIGCRCQPSGGKARPLVLGTTLEPTSLCPQFRDSAAAVEVIGLLQQPLVQRVDGVLQAGLAMSVPQLGVDAIEADGGMDVHWRLRPNARWSDGAPVVADDFILGWQLLRDEQQPVLVGREDGRLITAITADPDQHGFVIHLGERTPWFAERTPQPLPHHLLATSSALTTAWCRAPLSIGPMMVAQWQSGQFIRFVPNPHHEPLATIDEMLVRFVPSTDALALALRSGEVDITLPSAGLSSSEAEQVVADDAKLGLLRAAGSMWLHVDMNLDRPRLADVRVRMAMVQAVDWDALVAAVYGQGCLATRSFLSPQRPEHAPGPSHDVTRAGQLLDDAGWRLGKDGKRTNAAGESLRMVLLLSAGQRESERLFVLAQAAWRAVGIDAQLEPLPFGTLWERVKGSRDFDLAFFGWNVDEGVDLDGLFHRDRVPGSALGGQNVSAWRNDDASRITTELKTTLSPAARKLLTQQLQQRFLTDVPTIGVCLRSNPVVFNQRVEGPHPSGSRTPLAWNAAQWRLKS